MKFFPLCLIGIISGCASTKPFERFADAGVQYSSALDRLLDTEGKLHIDANSEKLLQDRNALYRSAVGSPQRLQKDREQIEQELQDNDKADKDHLLVIKRLRAHALLLGKYFRLLQALTAHSQGEDVKKSLDDAVSKVGELGKQLRGTAILTDTDQKEISSIGGLAVNSWLAMRLSDELKKHHRILRQELMTQELLLKALRGSIEADQLEIADIAGQRLHKEFLANETIMNEEAWIHDRRQLFASDSSDSLQQASEAARELRLAFERLTSGEAGADGADEALAEAGSLTSLSEAAVRVAGKLR